MMRRENHEVPLIQPASLLPLPPLQAQVSSSSSAPYFHTPSAYVLSLMRDQGSHTHKTGEITVLSILISRFLES